MHQDRDHQSRQCQERENKAHSSRLGTSNSNRIVDAKIPHMHRDRRDHQSRQRPEREDKRGQKIQSSAKSRVSTSW